MPDNVSKAEIQALLKAETFLTQRVSLTPDEENFIKDIIKIISNDEDLMARFNRSMPFTEEEFDNICDSVFKKLQNGRLTVISE